MSNKFSVDVYSRIANQGTYGERKVQALQVRRQRQQQFTDALAAHLGKEWAEKQTLHSNHLKRTSAQVWYQHDNQTLTKD